MILLAAEGAVNATAGGAGFAELLADVASNPTAAMALLVQFLLGFAAGYYMAKIARYIVALVAVFILGALIGAWGVSGTVDDALRRLGRAVAESKDAIMSILQVFGFVLVGPTALGFFVGLLVGVVRR
ncbi:MAG: hypothetical protein GXO15_06455 [Crenarchaeota archaeon]|nr:hypothetical protein [Thermoproteota archaeon]